MLDLPHQSALFRLQDRRIEIPGKIRDAVGPTLGRIHLEDVLFNGVREFHLLFDPVHPRPQHHGKGKIGVAGRDPATGIRSAWPSPCPACTWAPGSWWSGSFGPRRHRRAPHTRAPAACRN